MSSRAYPFYLYIGVLLILFMQLFIFLDARELTTWATPVFWTGLILVLDAVLYGATRRSLVRTGAVVPVAVISVIGWWVFEWFNIFLSNWHYENLVDSPWLLYPAYVWSFATIIPGIFLLYGVMLTLVGNVAARPFPTGRRALTALFLTGLVFLFIPIVPFSMYYVNRAADASLFSFLSWAANTYYSEFTAAFVWLGFALLLEPFNFLMGNPSLLRSMSRGDYRPLVVLGLSGLLCGYLWEFWNYWAHTKWHYTVPILGHIKLFEMPVLGYLGFIPFAWELYAMVALVYPRAIRIIEGENA